MARYKLYNGGVIRDDGMAVPNDPGNRHRREFEEWRVAGDTPDPADPSPTPRWPEKTPLTPEDVERLFFHHVPGMTRAKIDQAKRDCGKPLP